MTPAHPDSEEALELETIALFQQLGYTTANCYNEICGDSRDVPVGDAVVGRLYLGRETRSDVVLISKLRPALEKLNPHQQRLLPRLPTLDCRGNVHPPHRFNRLRERHSPHLYRTQSL
jgi:hypothetical protein